MLIISPHFEKHKQYETIDGLRGILAFSVFLHHSTIWFFYAKGDPWQPPPSSLFQYLGAGSVVMFFMVTSFLFFSMLINSRNKSIDWLKFYVSRFLRIAPLYYFLVFCMFFLVLIQTGFNLIQPLPDLIEDIIHWGFLSLLSLQNLNGIETHIILSSVLWTLPLEWMFYFLLPIFALLIFKKKIPKYIFFFILLGLILFIKNIHFDFFYPFLSGAIAAWLSGKDLVHKYAKSVFASLVIIFLLSMLIFFNPPAFSKISIFTLFICFLLIASGNDLFNLLNHPILKMLGNISYGIYLAHMMVLYVFFKLIIGVDAISQLNAAEYCLIILCLTPILVSICFLTYKYIEFPFMSKSSLVVSLIRKKFIFMGDKTSN